MTPQNFTLDKTLFNKQLYTNINDLWFEGLAKDARTAPKELMMRWFRAPPEEKARFDSACSTHTSEALASIAPDKLTLPPFESHETETRQAATLAKPFLDEVTAAQKEGDKQAADTLLALCLLLDQMPRNLFREPRTLPLVYQHYDRLAVALVRSSLELSPKPTDYKEYNLRPPLFMWYYMPLLHSEDLAAHRLWFDISKRLEQGLRDAGDDETADSMKPSFDSEQDHLKPLERFGRYSHRNEFLGRKNTPEEEEFLKTADTFGVTSGSNKDKVKDEL